MRREEANENALLDHRHRIQNKQKTAIIVDDIVLSLQFSFSLSFRLTQDLRYLFFIQIFADILLQFSLGTSKWLSFP